MAKSRAEAGKRARDKAERGLPRVETAYLKIPPDEANARLELRRREVAAAYEDAGPVRNDPVDPARLCKKLASRFPNVSFTAAFEGSGCAVHAAPRSRKLEVFTSAVSAGELDAAVSAWPEHAVVKAYAEGYEGAVYDAREDARRAKDEEDRRTALPASLRPAVVVRGGFGPLG